MDEIIRYLCPYSSLEDVEIKSHLITKYLEKKMDAQGLFQEPTRWVACPICGNQDERYITTDGVSGDMICLGSDGLGCGAILLDHMFSEPRASYYEHMDEMMYSDQYHHRSFWGSDKSHALRKINQAIEKKLTGMGQDRLMTSDHYKDQQRDYVYGLLNNMIETTNIDQQLISKVKALYHVYRTHMSRIHQLEVVLAGLFYIAQSQDES